MPSGPTFSNTISLCRENCQATSWRKWPMWGAWDRHLPIRTELNQLQPLSPPLNPYGPGQAISAADCHSISGTAATGYTGTVNSQPVSGTVATHLAIACGTSADPSRPFYGISGITNISNIGSRRTTLYRSESPGISATSMEVWHIPMATRSTMGRTDRSPKSSTPYNPQGSRASSNFDERHVLELSLVYDLPFFTQPGLLHSLLGGWQISDLTSFQSGMPFSIVNTQNADNAGTGNTVSNNGQSLVSGFTGSVQSYPDIVGPIHGPVAIRHPSRSAGTTTLQQRCLRRSAGAYVWQRGSQRSHPASSDKLRYGPLQDTSRSTKKCTSSFARRHSTSSTIRSGARWITQPVTARTIARPPRSLRRFRPTTPAFCNWRRSLSSNSK